mgnify:CR=1 FL=1|tara:strand:+ start:25187 stop:25768 length:582 start_codon:yes stop_codon:yes gene_type:complete
MQTYIFRLMCLLIALFVSACDQSHNDLADSTLKNAGSEQYPLLGWSELTPENWDEMALLKDFDLSNMEDDDPRAFELLKDVRKVWNNAPVNQGLDGKAVTIHGYVAPLDSDGRHVKTFLLVPYFGACIHSPPPPSNQVVYVNVAGNGIPLNGWDAFVAVSGTLVVAHTGSELGTAGYQMKADIVKPFADTIDP